VANDTKLLRCAIYTRKSTEHGLELEFNSLDAQRDACEAYIKSQASQGWRALSQQYDDPAYSGGNLERPALKKLLADIEAGKVDVVVVYKIDRLTRSLADFAKLVEAFDARSISFVAVTQQFNTTTSMGQLTLNILLSFAQFERELSSERVRDKIAASRRKGKWTGGSVPLGYETKDKKLVINAVETCPARDRCHRADGYPWLGRRAHPLRWSGDVGSTACALMLARSDDRPFRKLRCRFRTGEKASSPGPDGLDGRGGGDSEPRTGRRTDFGVGDLS
jgi:DNA invertase Pin-like site-specific DNA recombinase